MKCPIVKEKYVLTTNWNMEPYCRGWRYGAGEALAVVKPGEFNRNLESSSNLY